MDPNAPDPQRSFMFKNLVVTPAGGTLPLHGTAVAASNSTITNVMTTVGECTRVVTPAACGRTTLTILRRTFSSTTTSVPVTPDQQIAVTVTFTFSDATPPPSGATR